MGPMCQESHDIIHKQHKTTCRPIDSSTIETSYVTITVSAVVDVVIHSPFPVMGGALPPLPLINSAHDCSQHLGRFDELLVSVC